MATNGPAARFYLAKGSLRTCLLLHACATSPRSPSCLYTSRNLARDTPVASEEDPINGNSMCDGKLHTETSLPKCA